MSKLVIVSGGSRGMGAAIVKDLLASGYYVATFSRKPSDVIHQLQHDDPDMSRFLWQALDAENGDALRRFVIDAYKRFGNLYALINNAGVNLDALLSLTQDKDIHRVISVNLTSVITLSKAAVRVFLQQDSGGIIINVGSILGQRGFRGTSAYSATKSAVEGFGRSLARELGSSGIRVNTIAPGFIDTDMTHGMSDKQRQQIIRRTPLGRLGKVEDIIGVIRFLLSEDSRFITGQSLSVDGGLTC